MNTAKFLIEKFNLQPHPEGGFFRQTYKSDESIPQAALPERFNGDRAFSTAIYFLLDKGDFSAFHGIKQDEFWHFYTGSSVNIHVIDLNGYYFTLKLGIDFEQGEMPQAVVKAGCYFAAEINDKTSYALVGCTVAPGFDFADFEMPTRAALIEKFPSCAEIITKCTRL